MIETLFHSPHPAKLVSNLFQEPLFSSISTQHPLVVVCDSHVADSLLPPVQDFLNHLGYHVILLTFPQGETHKNFQTFLDLQDKLIHHRVPLSSTLIGFGGGISLDIAGFLSSTYCRGLPLILIPTTLVAMIDASIGGKNGINHQGYKNRIGTFYPPKEVWICPEFLTSLNQEERLQGLTEAIKHGCIADSFLWSILKKHSHDLFTNREILLNFIRRNCIIKASIVTKDLYDHHFRKILNFGHTLAHAIETLSKGKVSHGLAVGVGMMIELQVAQACGFLKEPDLISQLRSLLKIFSLPTSLAELRHLIPSDLFSDFYNPQNLLHALSYDKKNLSSSSIRMVMMEKLGQPAICDGFYCCKPDYKHLHAVLQKECHVMCNY